MAGSLTIDNINGKVISSSPVATESQVIGVGQTWQNVTSSRSLGVTYTNTTGKPIFIVIQGHSGGYEFNLQMTINGTVVCSDYRPKGDGNMRFIIKNGDTYMAGGILYISKWFELR